MTYKFGYMNSHEQDMLIVLNRTLTNKQHMLDVTCERYQNAPLSSARWAVVQMMCEEIATLQARIAGYRAIVATQN